METTFENADIGDTIWNIQRGFCRVIEFYKLDGKMIHITVQDKDDWVFQVFTDGKENRDDLNRTWFWDEVQIKAPEKRIRMKLVHGKEVPDLSMRIDFGKNYYFPDFTKKELYGSSKWKDRDEDFLLLEEGMCYPFTEAGKQAAILHTKANFS